MNTQGFWNMITGAVVAILVIVISFFLIQNFSSPAANIVEECNAVVADALLVPRSEYDRTVSFPVGLVGTQEINGRQYLCVQPVPGKEASFATRYASFINSSVNTGSASTPVLSSPNNIPTSYQRRSPINSKISFFINGNLITQRLNEFYDTTLPANGRVDANTRNTFRVEHEYTSEDRCELSIYPARIASTDNDRIEQDRSATGNYRFEMSFPDCNTPAEAQGVLLAALDANNFPNPGFYKWDFAVYNNKDTEPLASASTFVRVTSRGGSTTSGSSAGSSSSSSSSGSDSDSSSQSGTQTTVLRALEERIARNNLVTCYYAPYDVATEAFPSTFQVETSNSPTPSGNYNSISVPRLEQYLQDVTPQLRIDPAYLHLRFEENGATLTKTFSGVQCDQVIIREKGWFDGNFLCPNVQDCDDFSKTACTDPLQRLSGNVCDQNVVHCFWNRAVIGSCQDCGNIISSCSQYETEESCLSNQCMSTQNMDQSCFWEDPRFLSRGDCKTCNYNNPTGDVCAQYTTEESCNQDACEFTEKISQLCQWNHDTEVCDTL